MSHRITKPTKSVLSEVSDQPGHLQVWSESSLCAQWVAKDKVSLCRQQRLWSDQMDAQSDLSLHWVHMPFCWTVMWWLKSRIKLHIITSLKSRFAVTWCVIQMERLMDKLIDRWWINLKCLHTGTHDRAVVESSLFVYGFPKSKLQSSF